MKQTLVATKTTTGLSNQPEDYVKVLFVNFRMLQRFVDGSLDVHKWELAQLLYPVFVHMYLELVYNHHKVKSSSFFQKFR